MKKWVIKLLLSDDEKYLLLMAIEDRIKKLYEIKLSDKNANIENIEEDISYYSKMGTVFSTRNYNRSR